MATTAGGTPYVESSDLVANYPAVSLALAEHIDELPSGLSLVTPTSIANSGGSASASGGAVTFTGVTSVSLNGVFTSSYENYRIIITSQKVTGSPVAYYFRFRASGSDATGSNYNYSGFVTEANGTSSINAFGQNQTSGALQGIGTGLGIISADIRNPFTATDTAMTFLYLYELANGPGAIVHSVAASQDGFTIFPASGNVTGTIRAYGYQDS